MRPTRRTVLAGATALAIPGLVRADDALATIRARAGGFEQLHSLIVMKGGDPLIEDRFRGPGLDRPANIKSVSKTIVATLLGIAIDKGAVPSVDATLGQIATRLIPVAADPRVRAITLEDLVTLRAGLDRTSGPNYGQWVSSRNWVADALSRPMVAEPGGQMLYSTGSTHVLGAALSQATGRSLLDLARDWLGRPLDIQIPPWTRDPQGLYMGGNEMALSPRAMARFGEMVRKGGTWNGQQVVSRDWIERSFTPVTRSPWSGLGYGYGWFNGETRGMRYALARGYGGQVIAVAPEAGITVAITSDPTLPARSSGYFGDLMNLIERDILASLA
jgi:CubicO group peptidase (beta-lactamase class C family)